MSKPTMTREKYLAAIKLLPADWYQRQHVESLAADLERAEAERDALRALLRRVLSCGLNEYPPGAGFTPSKQERLAGELARDIKDALREGK